MQIADIDMAWLEKSSAASKRMDFHIIRSYSRNIPGTVTETHGKGLVIIV